MSLAEACPESSMAIEPTLLGERHTPEKNASVKNIHSGNLGLGQVFRALCHGLIENLYQYVFVFYLDTHILFYLHDKLNLNKKLVIKC